MPKTNEYSHDSYCHHHSPVWRMVRVLAFAICILIALMAGIAVGMRGSAENLGMMPSYRGLRLNQNSAGNMMYFNTTATSAWPAPAQNITGALGYNKAETAGTRIAGVISDVTGTKITLTDNGGIKQTVYTSGDTIITSGSSEIPLSSLKEKQFIVTRVSAQGGRNIAKTITVEK
jgi:hypothetical protein